MIKRHDDWKVIIRTERWLKDDWKMIERWLKDDWKMIKRRLKDGHKMIEILS
jgi:hypothetical protein